MRDTCLRQAQAPILNKFSVCIFIVGINSQFPYRKQMRIAYYPVPMMGH
jgi:hypothetical protein